MRQIYISFLFLVVNVFILLVILALNRRTGSAPGHEAPPDQRDHEKECLPASDILEWEFEYARITASEAMRERHTMINFYLLVAGVVASGVVAVLGQAFALPKATGTVLLWLLCGIGWLYFLGIIRLRQAWHESAQTMNQIKEFYFSHVKDFDPDALRSTFRWQAHTLPPPEKPWTVFFYSTMLIGFLDSAAYVAGGVLLDFKATQSCPFSTLGLLTLLGLVFFAFHVWLYFAFLKS